MSKKRKKIESSSSSSSSDSGSSSSSSSSDSDSDSDSEPVVAPVVIEKDKKKKKKKDKDDKRERKVSFSKGTSSSSASSNSSSSSSSSSPAAKRAKVETPEGRRRTRSFDKAEKDINAGCDENGNPPLSKFRLSSRLVSACVGKGVTHMFPIQAQTFDMILDGSDLIGRARTGMGKTLAFALPMAEKLSTDPRVVGKVRGRSPVVLCMAPTRELARQVSKEFQSISPWMDHTCIYGGSSYEPQKSAMWKGLDVVVGTPGRMIDHIERGTLKLNEISFFVLDEADQMLDMGFDEDIAKVFEAIQNQRREDMVSIQSEGASIANGAL